MAASHAEFAVHGLTDRQLQALCKALDDIVPISKDLQDFSNNKAVPLPIDALQTTVPFCLLIAITGRNCFTCYSRSAIAAEYVGYSASPRGREACF